MKKYLFVFLLLLTGIVQAQTYINAEGTLKKYWKIGKNGGQIEWSGDSTVYKVRWNNNLDSAYFVMTDNPNGNDVPQYIFGRKGFKAAWIDSFYIGTPPPNGGSSNFAPRLYTASIPEVSSNHHLVATYLENNVDTIATWSYVRDSTGFIKSSSNINWTGYHTYARDSISLAGVLYHLPVANSLGVLWNDASGNLIWKDTTITANVDSSVFTTWHRVDSLIAAASPDSAIWAKRAWADTTFLKISDSTIYLTPSDANGLYGKLAAANSWQELNYFNNGVYSGINADNIKGFITLANGDAMNAYGGSLTPTSLTGNRTYTLPDAGGTVALQEWVSAQGYYTVDSLSNYALLSVSNTFQQLNYFPNNIYLGINADNIKGYIDLANGDALNTYKATITPASLTGNRTYTGPDATGTIALQEWVGSQGYYTVDSLSNYANLTASNTFQQFNFFPNNLSVGINADNVQGQIYFQNGDILNPYKVTLYPAALTDNRGLQMPDQSGTIATQTYVGSQGFLTSESDPVFGASAAAGITGTNITNWNTAYSWVNSYGSIVPFTDAFYDNPTWINTLAKSKVGLSNVENTALSTWGGSSNIITVGTIGTGTWNATAIGDSYISSATNWNAAYNDKINSASFSTSTGVLTLTQQDSGTVTVDLDGKYAEAFTGVTTTTNWVTLTGYDTVTIQNGVITTIVSH